MARTDKLYDNARSKKLRAETQEAKKGDKKTIKGQEYESLGDEEPGMYYDRPTPEMGDKELPHEGKGKDGKREYWRPARKEKPMS